MSSCASRRSSAVFTEANIGVLPSPSLYTPTPRFILLGFGSFLNASVNPIMGSAGAIVRVSNIIFPLVLVVIAG